MFCVLSGTICKGNLFILYSVLSYEKSEEIVYFYKHEHYFSGELEVRRHEGAAEQTFCVVWRLSADCLDVCLLVLDLIVDF